MQIQRRPVLCLNSFSERSFLGERELNELYSACWTLLQMRSFWHLWMTHSQFNFARECQISIEPSRWKPHQNANHGGKNKWRQAYLRLCLHHKYSIFVWLLKTISWKGQWWSRWEKSKPFCINFTRQVSRSNCEWIKNQKTRQRQAKTDPLPPKWHYWK